MKRREFVVLLGGAAAWPMKVRALQAAMPTIGFLNSGSPEAYAPYVKSFREGLNAAGYIEGRDVAIEYRWANGQNNQLPALAADLVKMPVTVIAGVNSTAAVRAANAATSTIPIVFTIGADPVEVGLVKSFNHPGGNVTGISFQSNALLPKRLELLQELVPDVQTIGFVVNPKNPNAVSDVQEAEGAARTIGSKMVVANTSSEQDFEATFKALERDRVEAVLMDTDPVFTRRPNQIVALAARYKLPTLYDRREFVAVGGLICYGSSLSDAYRQSGIYTGRVFKGDKPSDLPIMQPTKFELVINLVTAKALGLKISPALLAIADNVIE
jgi:putative ABC transport system substrate-binding protein